LIRILN